MQERKFSMVIIFAVKKKVLHAIFCRKKECFAVIKKCCSKNLNFFREQESFVQRIKSLAVNKKVWCDT